MARYKIYDNKSDVITPVGEKLTAEQWLDRYQWGRYTKMIVGGGIINGSVALVFDDHNNRRQINNEINLGLFFSIYSDFGFYTVRPVRLDRSAKAFLH